MFTARLATLTALLLAAGCAQLPSGDLNAQDADASATAQPAVPVLPAVTTVGASANVASPAAPELVAQPVTVAAKPVAVAVEPVTVTAEPEMVVAQPVTVAAEPVAEPPRDMWDRIRSGYALPAIDNARVRAWEVRYTAQPDYVARMVERSSHFLFHIVEEIERRNMPMEIALLPMIESAYNPRAYSRAHASGLWQFVPATGRLYGLRQNWWYDGRRDVIAATNAALDYLEKLYAQFGDWELALASYNWGENAVRRAVARNRAKGRPTNYASLRMPRETRNYLPKLMAVKNIIENPEFFGIQLARVPNEPYIDTVTIQQHIDVTLAAKFAEMPLAEFKFLNPAHNKRVIKAGAAETIVLPVGKVALFQTNLLNHDEPLVSWQAHTIRRGERPKKIAARYGMSLTELKRVNSIRGRKKFRTGLPLLVQVTAGATPNLPDLPATRVTRSRRHKAARHKNARKRSRKTNARAKTIQATAKRTTVVVKPVARKNIARKVPELTVVVAQNLD